MRGWMVLGVMLLAAQSPPCEAAGRTRFAIGDQGGILVKAMLNGAGPFTLLLEEMQQALVAIAGAAAQPRNSHVQE